MKKLLLIALFVTGCALPNTATNPFKVGDCVEYIRTVNGVKKTSTGIILIKFEKDDFYLVRFTNMPKPWYLYSRQIRLIKCNRI